MKKTILSLVLSLIFIFSFAIPAFAATTADVTVTFTPEYIAISDNQPSYGFGVVAASSTPNTATNWCTITNDSTVQTDITIAVTGNNWTGDNPIVHSDTATPGEDTCGLLANRGGTWGVSDVIVKYSSPNYIYENCPATTGFSYGLKLVAPTSYTHPSQVENTVRITAAAG